MNSEGGTFAGGAFDFNGSAERFGQLTADGESKPCSLAASLGRVKRFENAQLVLGRNASPRIADGDVDQALVDARGNEHLTLGTHGVDGVRNQIDQNLTKQSRIGRELFGVIGNLNFHGGLGSLLEAARDLDGLSQKLAK